MKIKKIIILENIKSNELSLVFSKIVSKGLCCDEVWEISIFFILHTYPWYLQKVALNWVRFGNITNLDCYLHKSSCFGLR